MKKLILSFALAFLLWYNKASIKERIQDFIAKVQTTLEAMDFESED